jgi:hypothetical protein
MGDRAAGAGSSWRPPKLVDVPGYYNDRKSWEPVQTEDDESEGMYAWLDDVITRRDFAEIDMWLSNSGTMVKPDGTVVRERIVDLLAPEHDSISLFTVVLTDTRPESIATFKELLKQKPDRSYRDRKGRTSLDLLSAAMDANPGNAVLKEKYDIYTSAEKAANVGRLMGVSKEGLSGKLGRDMTGVVASMLTGEQDYTPTLVQKSKAMATAGLPGVKGGGRRARKTRRHRRHHRKGKTSRVVRK